MDLSKIFMGAPQSRYSGLFVMFAISIVSISILFGKDSMPLSQKFGAILLLILVSAPGILFSLFQLTCLVTGAGVQNQRWWCSVYAWIISALLIVYSILLVAMSLLSISNNSSIIRNLSQYDTENFDNNMAMGTNMAMSQMAGDYSSTTPAAGPVQSQDVMNTVGNGNNTDNKAYSYSSTVLSTDPTKEAFAGAIGDPNNRSSHIVGGNDEPSMYPFQ